MRLFEVIQLELDGNVSFPQILRGGARIRFKRGLGGTNLFEKRFIQSQFLGAENAGVDGAICRAFGAYRMKSLCRLERSLKKP